jgi:hypothetical protein
MHPASGKASVMTVSIATARGMICGLKLHC